MANLAPISLLLMGTACIREPQEPPPTPPPAMRASSQKPVLESSTPPTPSSVESDDYVKTLKAVAAKIENAKSEFPQLREFSSANNLDVEQLSIRYAYKTHKPRGRGGWSSAVPNPDEDGLWFRIDFYDENSTAQIHTQPVVPRYSFREKSVMLLMLEGKKTKPLSARLRQILFSVGVVGSP